MLVRVNILDWHFTDEQSDLRKLGLNGPSSLYSGARGAPRIWGGTCTQGAGGILRGGAPRVWGEHSGEVCLSFGGTRRELASLLTEAEDFLQKVSPGLGSPMD